MLWLISQLPEGSAYQASLKGGGEHRGWTMDRVLLAGIFNVLTAANYQRGNGKGRKPKMIDPPAISKRGAGGRSKAAAHVARGIAAARSTLGTTTPEK